MTDQVEMPLPMYTCHKQIGALKIKTIIGNTIVPEDEGYAPLEVSHEYLMKFEPIAGGYYVVYEDGYKSFSPAHAFEKGYTKNEVRNPNSF